MDADIATNRASARCPDEVARAIEAIEVAGAVEVALAAEVPAVTEVTEVAKAAGGAAWTR
ncbi:hypothetical protein [Catenulispora pinisilvae]|uniref:hypothetical protein n=1 Tax=Catenulispora pinisilvae TaxID=2705253 RepID=UPI001891117D|nr:hypothetical protein [Catenulispora pinisilvae]